MTPQHSVQGGCGCHSSRRRFLGTCGTAAGAVLAQSLLGRLLEAAEDEAGPARMAGPGGKYVPRVKAALFGGSPDHHLTGPMIEQSTEGLRKAAESLGMKVDLQHVDNPAQAEAWLAEAAEQKPDGAVVVALGWNAWESLVQKALDAGLPTVAYVPREMFVRSGPQEAARRGGAFVCAGTDFDEVVYGMKMLRARAVLREMRFMVVVGDRRTEERRGTWDEPGVDYYGSKLLRVPEAAWVEAYEQTELSKAVQAAAREYLDGATELAGPTKEDVFNAVRCYVSARRLLEQEQCDALTVNCLGAGLRPVPKPCAAFTRLQDSGVPAICEADLSAAARMTLVPLLFDRPGFMGNLVWRTGPGDVLISHCTCPTRLKGFREPNVPFHIAPFHGGDDAVVVPHWELGQKVTLLMGDRHLTILTGEVVDQVFNVPPMSWPGGGCMVSPKVKLHGDHDTVFDYPPMHSWHPTLCYGNWWRELRAFCDLFRIPADFPQRA